MPNIYLIRHGEKYANKYKKISGHYDTRLTDLGIWQAKQVGMYLKHKNIKKIYSSPLVRAKTTAKYISGVSNISDIILDERIIEKDMGNFNGRSRKRVRKEFKMTEHDDPFLLLENDLSVEKDHEVLERCLDFLDVVFRKEKVNLICVSHAGTINVLRSICVSWGNNSIPIEYKHTPNCSITRIEFTLGKPISVYELAI